MPRLFLHIGYPKTGTTTIQRFLTENKAKLAESGILYPDAGKLFHADSRRLSDAHYALTFALGIGSYTGSLEFPTAEEQMALLNFEVSASGCQTVLMSSEYFITAKKPETVKEFFKDWDVTIVVYLRRHDHAYESAYNQALKNAAPASWNKTIEAFILYQLGIVDVPYSYFNVLEKWGQVFGRSNILVRPFEKLQNRPDIYSDFMRVVGVENIQDYQRPVRELNVSLSHKTLCAIRAVRASALGTEKKNKIISRLLHATDETDQTPRYLSSAMRNAVLAMNKPSYASISKYYLNKDNDFFFRDPWPKPDEPWIEPVDPEPGELLELILRLAS